jgi:hypothetical protein
MVVCSTPMFVGSICDIGQTFLHFFSVWYFKHMGLSWAG